MSKPLHPSISKGRALVVFLLLSVGFLLPAGAVAVLSWFFADYFTMVWWFAALVLVSFGVVLGLFYALLFTMHTVGSALLLGTFLVFYALVSSTLLSLWEKSFGKLSVGQTSHDLLLETSLMLLSGQTLLSIFCAAVGAGLVTNCIFNSRVSPRTPDNKSGQA